MTRSALVQPLLSIQDGRFGIFARRTKQLRHLFTKHWSELAKKITCLSQLTQSWHSVSISVCILNSDKFQIKNATNSRPFCKLGSIRSASITKVYPLSLNKLLEHGSINEECWSRTFYRISDQLKLASAHSLDNTESDYIRKKKHETLTRPKNVVNYLFSELS